MDKLPNSRGAEKCINIAHQAFMKNKSKMPEDVQSAFSVVFMLAVHGMASQMMFSTALQLREILPDGEVSKEELDRVMGVAAGENQTDKS